MSTNKETIAIAGSGNIARYLVEEFARDGTINVVVISRSDREYLHGQAGVELCAVGEYSKEAVLAILDARSATAIVSTLAPDEEETYTACHAAILAACAESATCKRMIPSEFLGNIRDLPGLPRSSQAVRQPFRDMLAAQSAVRWTVVLPGWLADYFVQTDDNSRSYVRAFPAGWPVDLGRRTARIVGTGDEPVAWTSARDTCRAVVRLMGAAEWPRYTWVYGEIGTWNKAVEQLEQFHGCKFERTHLPLDELQRALETEKDAAKYYTLTIDEWSALGTCPPLDEARRQREKYFEGVPFRAIAQLLEASKRGEII